jgi:hypothetical protein
MKRNASALFAVSLSCLPAITFCDLLRAAESGRQATDAGKDPIAVEFNQLGVEYDRLAKEQAKSADGAAKADDQLSDEQWLQQGRAAESRSPDPDTQLLPQFLDFARSHPDSPLAFDALFFIIHRGGPQTGDVHGRPWQVKEQALDVVLQSQMDDPRVVFLLDTLGGSLPSEKTEAFLRQAFEKGATPTVRAAGGLGLANYFRTFSRAHERSRQIKDKAKLLNFERFWKLVVTPYLEGFPLDEHKNSAEIERLLTQVVADYGAVSASDWKRAGPASILVQDVPFSQPKTYGDFARAMLFELRFIAPGKPAPDIEGVDAYGKRFRLSDYQGKVVLLTFSANWCRPCVEMYPIERQIIERFREAPFALLSVSRDERVETLKSAIDSGKITWRCWWDGMEGPIQNAWNRPGAPTIFLLDHQHTFQNSGLSKLSSYEEFEKAIDGLIQRAPPNVAPSE